MTPIVLVHGIGASQGKGSIDRLAKPLEQAGHSVINFDYRYSRLWHQRFSACHEANAEHLEDICERTGGAIVVAHSNGCRVANTAAWFGTERRGESSIRQIIAFAPAMAASQPWPELRRGVDIIHNPHDIAIMLGALLTFHPFGQAGAIGYSGEPATWVRNHCRPMRKTACRWNHSHYFIEPEISRFVALTQELIGANADS